MCIHRELHYILMYIHVYIYIYLKRFAQSAGPGSASFLTRFMSVECLLESLLPFCRHLGSSLAALFASRTRLERQSCHRRRQGGKCKYKTTLLETILDTVFRYFQDVHHFFNVFSRRCSSHPFLVHLCTFSNDFCTHFVFHVICARSDLDCTGIAQTHVLTFERPEKLQKNRAEKYSDLKLHLSWILAPFWVLVLTKI